ncbi:MAG: glycosyltransferase [Thermoplasmatota archaeon]
MRIALVSPFDPFAREDASSGPDAAGAHLGGVERVLREVACGLASRGNDVSVVTTAREAGHETTGEGIELVRIRRLGTAFRTPLSRLARHVPDCDVVHVPATYPGTSEATVWANRKRRPVLLDYHFDPCPPGRIARLGASAWSVSLGRAMRSADIVTARSADYAASSPFLSAVTPTKMRFVPNGIHPREFPLRLAKDDFVLFVGRLVPYKGVEILLRAMAEVQRSHPTPLLIAGEGPARAALVAEAARLGTDVRFIGYVPDVDLPDLYGRARLTVLPSVNRQEAFGICLLESMATGTPIVASALPGVRLLAREGGVAVPPGDPVALAAALRAVLSGATAVPAPHDLRRRVQARYSWDAIVPRFLEAYEDARLAFEDALAARARFLGVRPSVS